jgi:hypothetical protein
VLSLAQRGRRTVTAAVATTVGTAVATATVTMAGRHGAPALIGVATPVMGARVEPTGASAIGVRPGPIGEAGRPMT